MRRVLMVTHDFPGSGGLRLDKFARRLPGLGYEPIILTVRTGAGDANGPASRSGDRVRTERTLCLRKSPFRIFSKFFHSWHLTTYFESLFFIPDLYVTWLPTALARGYRLIREEKIDIILTSSPPESLHLIGLVLARLTGARWIADFQDLWTTKKVAYRPPTALHDRIVKRLERAVYDRCDHIIANTRGNERFYKELFGIDGRKITVIPNGYDGTEKRTGPSRTAGRSDFTIGYMGYFDKKGFPWQDFLLSLKKLVSSPPYPRIKLHICGYMSMEAKKFIQDRGISAHIVHHGDLPHAEAFDLIGRCDLLLLLMFETPYSRAIVPHKLYYYLAMSKPVLAIAEKGGEVDDIIGRTGTGTTIPASDRGEIERFLSDRYMEWQARGALLYAPDPAEIEVYEYGNLTLTLKETMERVLSADRRDACSGAPPGPVS
ncbi:MAG: glycosyltransferase family 4 protein [Syntrophorhabdales bacterium]